ncbi:hypothetical protein ARZXY2_4598 (plasmid) [Arthrobacter sp. ZXY-2]|nr:hypothetical protein ARZXY2_4598 [Arthrobacter sp. ZXY-2]
MISGTCVPRIFGSGLPPADWQGPGATRSGLHAEVAIDGSPADSDYLSNVRWLQTLGLQLLGSPDLPVFGCNFAPPGPSSHGCSHGHAGSRALGQLVPLQLGKGSDDSHHGLSHGSPNFTVGIRGNAITHGAKFDAASFEIVQEFQQVPGVAAQPVQLPDDHLIATPESIQQLVQLRAADAGSAHSVVLVDAFTARLFQFAKLQIRVLVRQAHARITQTCHRQIPVSSWSLTPTAENTSGSMLELFMPLYRDLIAKYRFSNGGPTTTIQVDEGSII